MNVIKRYLKKRRYQRESFLARMHMENAAQRDIDARLKRMELAYRNKTRTR